MSVLLLLLLFNLDLLLPIHGELVIKPSAHSLTRDQYKSFVGLCSSSSSSRVNGWRSPQGKEVPENEHDRVTIERQGSAVRLRIQNLTVDDQGTWACFGADEKGQSIEKSLQLNIRVPISFYGDSIQYAPLDESVVIHCRVQASPLAEITWFKGADKSRIDDGNYELIKEGLRIQRVNMSSNDTFWCRADVLETGESQDHPILVIVSKSIGPTRIICASPCAVEKKTATLICEASGLPTPKYLWFYGSDSPVGASEVPKFVVRGRELTINYVDETDNGKYTCHAFNDYDRQGQRAEYNLNVTVPPRLVPIPSVEINLDSQKPQRALFQCRVERGSAESLTLEWRYANDTLIESTSDIIVDKSQYETNKIIELRFDPVRREHFGNYSCFAKNLAENASAMASLYLQFSPIYVGPALKVISTIPNYRSIMRCQFESYPVPQIQWIKMSRTVQDPEGRILAVGIDQGVNDITSKQINPTLFESVLAYTPTERDFGLSFECRALNPRIGRHAFTLQRAQPPKKVNITEIKTFSSSAEITIESSDLGDLPVVQYILKYDLQDPKQSQLQTSIVPAELFVEQQKIKLDHLRPSTNYQFTIAAESQAGVGQQAGPILFRTLDRQRPNFLLEQNENTTCVDDETCLISWNIQSDGGAPIIRTEITYGLAKDEEGLEAKEEFNTPINIDPSLTEFELMGLKPATGYIVLLKLYNEAGAAEQRARIKTQPERTDRNAKRKNALITDYRKNQPTKWAIIGIIIAIVLSVIIFVSICVILRVCRAHVKDTSNQSDHQTTPMMNGDDHFITVKVEEAA